MGGAETGMALGQALESPLEETADCFGRFQLNLYEDLLLSSSKILANDCLYLSLVGNLF